MRIAFVATAFFLASATTAFPENGGDITANFLSEACESPDRTFGAGICYGIVTGVVQVSRARFCVPKGAVGAQLFDVVKKYLRDHPERRHLSAGPFVEEAMQRSFPCPQ